MEFRSYAIRPFSKPARTDLKDVFRLYLSPATMLLHELHAGDGCLIQIPAGSSVPAVAWPAPEKITDSVVQTSKTLQSLYGLKLGDKVSILRKDFSIIKAQTVTLCELYPVDANIPFTELSELEGAHWAWFLAHIIKKAELICPGMFFNDVELVDEKRSFRIVDVNSSKDLLLHQALSGIEVQILGPPAEEDGASTAGKETLYISSHDIGGLAKELALLNGKLAAYSEPQRKFKFPSYYRRHRGGIILHGPSGTGKSMLLSKIRAAQWRKSFQIDRTIGGHRTDETEKFVHEIFVDACRYQPSVIIVDDAHTILGRTDILEYTAKHSISRSICDGLDQLGNARVLVIVATTTLSAIDETLRRPGRLECEIEIMVPDSRSRTEILKIASGLPKDSNIKALESLGDRTHGFVGADLDKVVQVAVDKALQRVTALSKDSNPRHFNEADQAEAEIKIEVLEADLNNALLEVRPTAMRQVFLETPRVKWNDIGGQGAVKRILKQVVEWPFKYPSEMERLGIEPRKGLVLYGPPGCSKTLVAKAVATEADLNFIAVKGAEMLSMYVGESERAIREVFHKARAASPSIIFFDEIDAMGASRGGPGQQGGLNVVTTLLNELDGIELLKGVFVLAATNKPENLDPALLRPGRLDSLLYIGLPDFEARLEIVKIRLRKVAVEDDVDLNALGEATEGYSGAEIVSICQRAGLAALEDRIEFQNEQNVGQKHFDIALKDVQRRVTSDMLEKYKLWGSTAL